MGTLCNQPSRHPRDGREILFFVSRGAFRSWLKRNCDKCEGIWLKFAKKGKGVVSVNYVEALDVALCYGWIDSQVMRLDETYYLQRFTPRGKRSPWSKINCGKVEKLIAAGEMTARGLREIDAAKADGRWARAYAGQKSIGVPQDFRKMLDANPRAAKFFAGLSPRNRYAILYRIQDAKRPETRRKRMETSLEMLTKGQTLH